MQKWVHAPHPAKWNGAMAIASSGALIDVLRQYGLLSSDQLAQLPHLVQGRCDDARKLAKMAKKAAKQARKKAEAAQAAEAARKKHAAAAQTAKKAQPAKPAARAKPVAASKPKRRKPALKRARAVSAARPRAVIERLGSEPAVPAREPEPQPTPPVSG